MIERFGILAQRVTLAVLVSSATASAHATPPAPPARFAPVVSSVAPVDHHSCVSRGSALYLGDDLYLTAAHVLLDAADLSRACRFPTTVIRDAVRKPGGPAFRLHVGGRLAQGRIVTVGPRRSGPSGEMDFAGSADFAIIRARTPHALPMLLPCPRPPQPNQKVAVLLRDGVVTAHVAAMQSRTSDDLYIDLATVFEHGTSGAGVLDATTSCVLGVISHRWPEPTPRVTRMTPIAVFAGAWRDALHATASK